MNYAYYPGCRIKGRYPNTSTAISKYLLERYGLDAEDCCKKAYGKLNADTSALLICNNCASELNHLVEDLHTEFVYQWILKDSEFAYPDYHGKHYFVQMCHHGYGDFEIESVVKALLEKMHITYTILPEEVPAGSSYAEHTELVKRQAKTYGEDVVTICGICNLALLNEGKRARLLAELLFQTEA